MIRPTFMRSKPNMFNIFRVKTKIEIQVEEYVRFKSETAPFIAKDHKSILGDFLKQTSNKKVSEITLEELHIYHQKIRLNMTAFTCVKHMRAIRGFIRFHKNDTEIGFKSITNDGIVISRGVGKKTVPLPDIRPKLGRPLNIELVKKIKRLRNNEKLSFRAIGKALGKDVKNVYRMYKYEI